VLVGAITAVLGSRDDPDARSATSPSTSGAPTSFDPFSVLAPCPSPGTTEWTSLGTTGTAETGPTGDPASSTKVVDGYVRTGTEGQWAVLLDVEYTALADGSQYQYWWYYELTADGRSFEPSCFSVTGGQDPACCGETTEVLVGFDTTTDPSRGATLLIEDGLGGRGQIDLVPT
jgi:hypothetical protein